MNDKDLEQLLKAMPLKKPLQLPLQLSPKQDSRWNLTAVVRNVICCRIPLWQATAAAMVLIVITASIRGNAPHETVTPVNTKPTTKVLLPLAPKPEPAAEPEIIVEVPEAPPNRFWVLPYEHRKRIAIARAVYRRKIAMKGKEL